MSLAEGYRRFQHIDLHHCYLLIDLAMSDLSTSN